MHVIRTIRDLFLCILDLQPIPRESLVVARPLQLVPTIELIKYSFVPHHQHGRRASQELTIDKSTLPTVRFDSYCPLLSTSRAKI